MLSAKCEKQVCYNKQCTVHVDGTCHALPKIFNGCVAKIDDTWEVEPQYLKWYEEVLDQG